MEGVAAMLSAFAAEGAETALFLQHVNALRRAHAVRDVSFEVRAGEVVAITGLVGAGRTETARLIAGADPLDGGTVEIDGVAVSAVVEDVTEGAGNAGHF